MNLALAAHCQQAETDVYERHLFDIRALLPRAGHLSEEDDQILSIYRLAGAAPGWAERFGSLEDSGGVRCSAPKMAGATHLCGACDAFELQVLASCATDASANCGEVTGREMSHPGGATAAPAPVYRDR